MNKQFKKVWKAPVLLAGVTLFGLLSALLGTGIWYWLAWVAMLVPLLVMLKKVCS